MSGKQVPQFRSWSRPGRRTGAGGDDEDLFSRARRDRDEALDRVAKNADPDAVDAWWVAMGQYVRENETLFCDDFIAWGEARNLPRLRNLRALGPLYLKAQRLGLIRDSETTRKSVRSHLSRKPVWESQVYAGRRRESVP